MSISTAMLTAEVAERIQERQFPRFPLSTSLGSIWQYPRDVHGVLAAFFMPGLFDCGRVVSRGPAAPERFPECKSLVQSLRERYLNFARRGFDPVLVTGQTANELTRVRSTYNFHIPILADSETKLLGEIGIAQFGQAEERFHPCFAITVYGGLIRGIFFRFEHPEELISAVLASAN